MAHLFISASASDTPLPPPHTLSNTRTNFVLFFPLQGTSGLAEDQQRLRRGAEELRHNAEVSDLEVALLERRRAMQEMNLAEEKVRPGLGGRRGEIMNVKNHS